MTAAATRGMPRRSARAAVGQPTTPDQSLIEIVDLSMVEASARVPEHLAQRVLVFDDEELRSYLSHPAGTPALRASS